MAINFLAGNPLALIHTEKVAAPEARCARHMLQLCRMKWSLDLSDSGQA